MFRVTRRLFRDTRDLQAINVTNAIVLLQSQNVQTQRKSLRQTTCYLLRALLRQCTYLPDPSARKYLRSHIVSRFRKYCPRQHPRSQFKQETEDPERIPRLLREGDRNLKLLIRANDGHPGELHKVLGVTYGRRGKRKHELLHALKAEDNSLDANNFLRPSDPLSSKKIPHLTDIMAALVKSQKGQKTLGFDKSPIKNLKPVIDRENAWGRPMPLNRAANQRKKWYAMTLDALLPPLPEHEWQRLGGLASGRVPWEGPVPRRRQAAVSLGGGKEVQNRARAGNVSKEPEGSEHSILNKKYIPDVKTNPHRLTPRYMRSLWAKIFVQCPLVTWDVGRKRWNIQWGNIHKDKELVLSPHYQEDISLFEEIEELSAAVPGR